eukprot:365389-Chlamydomonas_euryale.AAC.12
MSSDPVRAESSKASPAVVVVDVHTATTTTLGSWWSAAIQVMRRSPSRMLRNHCRRGSAAWMTW